jgi:hypothetical protein
MIPGLEATPPEVAFVLGFFIALSLRQGRLKTVIDSLIPGTE